MTLTWKYLRDEAGKPYLTAQASPNHEYIVRDATIWKDSQPIEIRSQAVLVTPAGEIHLGYGVQQKLVAGINWFTNEEETE